MMTTPTLSGLRWAIKYSFLEYISRMPDGKGSVSDGARPAERSELVFEPDPTPHPVPEGADRLLAFRGDVRFAGHYGMLFVRICDPWVVLRGTQAELTVVDPYKPEEDPRVRLVTFELPEASREGEFEVWRIPDVRLAAEGCGLFNDVYPEGEPFEQIAITLPVEAE